MPLAPAAANQRTLAACVSLGLSLLAPVLAAATVGCNNSGSGGGGAASPTAASSAGGQATLAAAGKTVYANNGCAKCHAISGQGGNGPDLTRVAANPEHTSEWLVAHIKNPKAHNPGSRMPSFEGRISDKDLLALGAYLASLK